MKTRKRLGEWDVAIYCRVRGGSTKEVDEMVTRFCNELKKKLGPRLVIRSVEVDK